MKPYRSTLLLLFGGFLLASFLISTPALADMQEHDEKVRKFLQEVAAKDKAGAIKTMDLPLENSEGISMVQNAIDTLGGKKIDDITRIGVEDNWTNGNETLSSTHHIRTGKEGYYFYYYYAYETTDKKPPTVEFSFDKAEADPWEVHTINFTQKHWAALLVGVLLGLILLVILAVWTIRHFMAKGTKPPKLPGG